KSRRARRWRKRWRYWNPSKPRQTPPKPSSSTKKKKRRGSSSKSWEKRIRRRSRMTEGLRLAALRRVASVITAGGAVISLGCMFVVGRHQKSAFLIALFTGWVLAPFIALIYAHAISQGWGVRRSMALYIFMLLLT